MTTKLILKIIIKKKCHCGNSWKCSFVQSTETKLITWTTEAFIGVGFILLMRWKRWTGQYDVGAGHCFHLWDSAQLFFFPLRVTHITPKSISLSSAGEMTSETPGHNGKWFTVHCKRAMPYNILGLDGLHRPRLTMCMKQNCVVCKCSRFISQHALRGYCVTSQIKPEVRLMWGFSTPCFFFTK